MSWPASSDGVPDRNEFEALCPVERPYTPLFMALRKQCCAVIEQMDEEAAEIIRVAISYEEAAAWQAISPHEIIAQIDWDHDCINLAWVDWDGERWAEGEPVKADWSPNYPLDLEGLKQASWAHALPQAWFESHALLLLAIVQDHQVKVRLQPSTGETHYERILVYALGLSNHPRPFWVGDAIFTFNDRRDQEA
jgi:hypothetical protein